MPIDPLGIDPHFDYTHGILKNLPGFTTQAKLDRFETAEGAEALVRLQVSPIKGSFNSAHLKEIHRRIFQSIYPWAGEFRQVNIRRSASYFFAVVQFLEQSLDGTLAKLASEDRLKGLAVDDFSSRSAYYLGELNAIHPFREGNGRTQREFIRQLATEAGYRINWGRVTREQMYEASADSHNLGKNSSFAALIRTAIVPNQRLTHP
jgi:cell filamentation protein